MAQALTLDANAYRLETTLPLAATEQAMVGALNRAVAEVTGKLPAALPVKPLVSGLRHDAPFAYAVLPPYRPFRLASNDLHVVLNCLAHEMGVTDAFRRHQSLPEPGHA